MWAIEFSSLFYEIVYNWGRKSFELIHVTSFAKNVNWQKSVSEP
jgi:hypothetical protein